MARTSRFSKAVGDENAYIFGAANGELPELRRHYDPRWHYENVPGLSASSTLTDGTLGDSNSVVPRHPPLDPRGGCDQRRALITGDFAARTARDQGPGRRLPRQKAWNTAARVGYLPLRPPLLGPHDLRLRSRGRHRGSKADRLAQSREARTALISGALSCGQGVWVYHHTTQLY